MMIALTGVTGAMGGEVLFSLMHDTDVTVRCIVFEQEKKLPSFVKKLFRQFKGRIESFRGDIAMVLENADIVLVSEMPEETVRAAFLTPARSAQEALDAALKKYGPNATVIVMPHGGSTLPVAGE